MVSPDKHKNVYISVVSTNHIVNISLNKTFCFIYTNLLRDRRKERKTTKLHNVN